MGKSSVRRLTLGAMIAALYAVLGYFGNVFGLTFGPFQIRLAEALTVLPFFFPAAAPGLAVGCLLTNLISPYGPLDAIFGTLATALAAFFTARMPRWYLAPLPPVMVNALILPLLWAWTQTGAVNDALWSAWAVDLLTFLPGQAAACCLLGAALLRTIPKIRWFRQFMEP